MQNTKNDVETEAGDVEVGIAEYRRFLTRQRRRRNLSLAGGAAAVCAVIVVAVMAKPSLVSSDLLKVTGALPIVVALTLSISFVGGALNYLRPTAGRRDYEVPSTYALRAYIDFKFDEALSSGRNSASDAERRRDRQRALQLLEEKFESEALSDIVEKIKAGATEAARRGNLDARLQMTRDRLSREVQDLARRGNLNLVLGILTTMIGLVTLGLAVIASPVTNTLQDLLSHFLPRLSLAVLIEVFAYFFLKLYKQTLSEIKYFQNELTNVESKAAAAMFALEAGNASLFEKVALTLSETERNFILDKGQTTVELEREKFFAKSSDQAVRALADTLRGFAKAK